METVNEEKCGALKRGPKANKDRFHTTIHLQREEMDWLEEHGYQLSQTVRVLLRRFRKAKDSKLDFMLIRDFDSEVGILR